MTRKSTSKRSTKARQDQDAQAAVAQPETQADMAQADTAPNVEGGNGAQGVMPEGEAKADAAHLNIEHNRLVDHGYLTEEEFGTVAETLQRNLATTISLYLKFKKYHWDIRGRFFRDLHLAYDEFIDMVFPAIDEQAERLVALGGSPIAADRKSTRLNSSHSGEPRMPSSA